MLRQPSVFLLTYASVCCLSGCGLNANKQEAERIADNFLLNASQKNWDIVEALCCVEFFEKSPRWRETFMEVEDKLGVYRQHELRNFRVQSNVGAYGSRQIVELVYFVKRSKVDTIEKFSLLGSRDEFKVFGYNVDRAPAN